MPWIRLTLHAESAFAEPLADWLAQAGAIAVTLEDAGEKPFFETRWDEPPVWERVRVSALFPEGTDAAAIAAEATAHFALREAADSAAAVSRLDDADWAESWKAHHQPLRIAEGLWVVPSWCEPPQPQAVNLVIDPGLAFGTGDHPTTALCLEWLAAQQLAGMRVLDYGCGSGILAIAALKLGAAEAWAVDLDRQALEVTRANAERNAVAARLHVLEPAALPTDLQADIVVANILAGALIELAPTLAAHTRRGGGLALSGILEEQAEAVRSRYTQAHFVFGAPRLRGSWVLLAGYKTK